MQRGSKQNGKALSNTFVRRVHAVLQAALKQAVKERLIPYNPCENCRIPVSYTHLLQTKSSPGTKKPGVNTIPAILADSLSGERPETFAGNSALDVYKRQELSCFFDRNVVSWRHTYKISAKPKLVAQKQVYYYGVPIMEVSYKDVYKRQVVYVCAARRRAHEIQAAERPIRLLLYPA